MPKSVSWDSSFDSSPADTDSVKDGALRIRETRLGVHERLELEHHFGAGAGDEEGRHKFPVGDVTARDGLIGVADQMIYFLEEVAGIYLQLRKDGAWVDVRSRNADHADSADLASNADKLDGYDAGNASGQVPISNGTLCIDLNADKLDGYDAGNSASQVPVSNGTVCSNLNADLLDGKHAADLASNDLSNVDDNVVLTKVKNVDGAGSGLDADTVDGLHASSFANTSLSNVADSTVLAKVKNVDGSGSGLNADLLDGLHASAFARTSFSNASPPRYNWQASGAGVTSGSFAVTSPRTYLVIVNGTLPVDAPGQPYEYWVNIEGVTRNIYVANHPDGCAPWTVNAVVAVTDGSLNFSCHSSLRIKSVTAVCIGGA